MLNPPNESGMASSLPVTADKARPSAPTCSIVIGDEFGWRRYRHGPVTLWYKGWMQTSDGAAIAARLADAKNMSADWLRDLLTRNGGHYALAAEGPCWGFAAVDWIRSIPLAAAKLEGKWVVDDQPDRLRRRAGLGAAQIDADAALSLAMAGYAIDAAALYRGLELLAPGELFWFAGGDMQRHRYYAYRPWRVRPCDSVRLEKDLAETTLAIMERTLASLNGRALIVPLSAGRDSRLIVSAAHRLGYKNVRCFAYGRAGNFEAAASRAIAERLGYNWQFVPSSIGGQRRFFASDDYARYLDFADSDASLPFVQDMDPLLQLKKSGYVPQDAVIINGNSGDYITGNHIPESLTAPAHGLDAEARWRRIFDALTGKHFMLWRSLATPANRARIAALLRDSIERVGGALGDPETDHGLYEYAEFQDRQCKYVVGGQRIYEFLGHEWRLPLWDNDYLRFWEAVPLGEKAGQGLYARMLRNQNWGCVWRDIPVNRKSVRPLWLVPLRLAAKALHAPLGRERWHRFERRYFQYWMETTGSSACVPFATWMRDARGARHHISWLAAIYLARHGVNIDAFAVA